MRVLLYSMNYAPEMIGSGKYSGELGSWLARSAVEVRVIAAPPYYPEWTVQQGYRAWAYRKERIDNVMVWRCPVWVPRKLTGLKRILHLISFAVSSLPVAVCQALWRPDAVLIIEPPIACAPGGLLAAWIGRSRSWLHVQDFEVDAAFDLGLIRSDSGKRVLSRIERWLMSKFDRVSTISTRMCRRLSDKGVGPDREVLFRNWIDAERFEVGSPDETLRAELGIPSVGTVVLYSGNMGQKQGLETVLEAARLLQKEKMVFVMCGDGAARDRLMQSAANLENLHWLPLQPEEKFAELLNLADIHLLPQRADVADLVMPSKLGAMLASGRPVVAMARKGTEVAEVVDSRGVVIEPEDPQLLAGAIRDLVSDEEKRTRLGALGRRFAIENLDKESILKLFLQEINGLVNGNTPQNNK